MKGICALMGKSTNINNRYDPSFWTFLKNKQSLILIIAASIIVFSLLSPHFLSSRNIILILRQNAVLFIIAVAMTFVLADGGIDLSIGSNMAMSHVVAAVFMRDYSNNYGIIIGIIVGIGIATFAGAINGFLISRWKLNPWLVTLSTMISYRGIAYIASSGQLVSGIPKDFTKFISSNFAGIPTMVIIATIVAVIFHIILLQTKFGICIKGIGSNFLAALYCGLPVKKYTVYIYTISGLLAGIGGLVYLGRAQSASAYTASGIELYAVAAAVIGGTKFSGGEGSISGTILGILIIGIIQNGITLLGLTPSWVKFFNGFLIIVAVVMDQLRARAYEIQ
jgi:ribose/xylose/arabinose/galactoside ABC-type transport system permease subunit